jgi:hypothetical protein
MWMWLLSASTAGGRMLVTLASRACSGCTDHGIRDSGLLKGIPNIDFEKPPLAFDASKSIACTVWQRPMAQFAVINKLDGGHACTHLPAP